MIGDPRGRSFPQIDRAFAMVDAEETILGEKHYPCAWRQFEDGRVGHICSILKKCWIIETASDGTVRIGLIPPMTH